MKQRNKMLDLSFEFVSMVIEFSELLEQNRKYVIARQLLKAGTSIGANVWEAQSWESKLDFIHEQKLLRRIISTTTSNLKKQ